MSEQEPDKDSPGPFSQPNRLRYVSVGLEFILTFGVFLAAGLLLDLHLGTVPGLTVLGAAIGFALALRRLVQQAAALFRERNGRKDEGDGDRPPEA